MIMNMVGGGSSFSKGIIRSFEVASGDVINDGDYVQFVKGSTGSITTLSSATNSGCAPFGVEVRENVIMVLSVRNNSVYGSIYNLNGTTLTYVSESIIATGTSMQYAIGFAYNDDKLFIAYVDNALFYGVLCTMSGNIISVGTPKLMYNAIHYQNVVNVGGTFFPVITKFNNNGLIIGINANDTIHAKYMICTIDTDANFTSYSPQSIGASTTTGAYHSPCFSYIDDNKLLVAYPSETWNTYYQYMNIGVAVINGSTLTLTNLFSPNVSLECTSNCRVTLMDDGLYYAIGDYDKNNGVTARIGKYKNENISTNVPAGSNLSTSYQSFTYAYSPTVFDEIILFNGGSNGTYLYDVYDVDPKFFNTMQSARTQVQLSAANSGNRIYRNSHILTTSNGATIIFSGSQASSAGGNLVGCVLNSNPLVKKCSEKMSDGVAISNGVYGGTVQVRIPEKRSTFYK